MLSVGEFPTALIPLYTIALLDKDEIVPVAVVVLLVVVMMVALRDEDEIVQ